MAEALLERETIDGSEIVQLVQQGMEVSPRPAGGNGAGVPASTPARAD